MEAASDWTVADPDLELKGGGGGGLFCFASFRELIFFCKIRGAPAPRNLPLDPPLTEGAGVVTSCFEKPSPHLSSYIKS